MTKNLLFSLTKKDFKVEFFRSGGPGGQKQNKTSSACRITHAASGAVGECRNHRSQDQNKKEAFNRLLETSVFQNWLKATIAAVEQGFRDIEAKVEASMAPDNIKVEFFTPTEKG